MLEILKYTCDYNVLLFHVCFELLSLLQGYSNGLQN